MGGCSDGLLAAACPLGIAPSKNMRMACSTLSSYTALATSCALGSTCVGLYASDRETDPETETETDRHTHTHRCLFSLTTAHQNKSVTHQDYRSAKSDTHPKERLEVSDTCYRLTQATCVTWACNRSEL